MSLLSTISDRIVVRMTSNNRYESKFLRQYFVNKYRISVGLYSIGCFDRWRIPPGTSIGRYCSISTSARLIDGNHPTQAISTHPYFYLKEFGLVGQDMLEIEPPVVEDDVWIGHNSIVTPECKRVGRCRQPAPRTPCRHPDCRRCWWSRRPTTRRPPITRAWIWPSNSGDRC